MGQPNPWPCLVYVRAVLFGLRYRIEAERNDVISNVDGADEN